MGYMDAPRNTIFGVCYQSPQLQKRAETALKTHNELVEREALREERAKRAMKVRTERDNRRKVYERRMEQAAIRNTNQTEATRLWRLSDVVGQTTSQKHRDKIDAIKLEAGCMDCGYNSHSCALDFDHRDPTSKLFTISNGSSKHWTFIQEEIDKCDIVCANCHRVRTKERSQSLTET